MPTYDYRCTICEEEFEVFQSFSEDSLTTIEGKDHEHTVKKVFSPVGISFKGSGFYKNDSSSKKGSTSDSSGSESGSDTAKKSEKSSSSSETSKSTSDSPKKAAKSSTSSDS